MRCSLLSAFSLLSLVACAADSAPEAGTSFKCSGPVEGTSNVYEIAPDGKGGSTCAIVKPGVDCAADPRVHAACGVSEAAWGSTPIGYYICPVNHPTLVCIPLTGECTCY